MSTRQICIGIHVHEQPEQLQATLESVRRNTAPTVQLILLPDGPGPGMKQALRGLGDILQFATEEPLGPPACFNRLAANSDATIVVLLESGVCVAPYWLDRLLAALDADSKNGLAGPSTNRAWNEQGVFPNAGGTVTEIARTGQEAAQRFGTQYRTLEPLYSLADFCYAVKREVIEAIGRADEGYGLGPCWEMDYNIRAARAGFRGVWACGAYVYRPPFTARRRQQEVRLFETNKQLYQDRFCALRLRGQRATYEAHCRGDACEHFAPPQLIQITRPLPAASVSITPGKASEPPRPSASERMDAPPPRFRAHEYLAPPLVSIAAAPLVSCIMPTRDRPDFALQAVRYFLRQDYPARELIIVDDSRDAWDDQLPADSRIRLVKVAPGQSIGAKRNRACEEARGEIIAQWDDDDWYAPNRLSAQVAPLLAGAADICGLTGTLFFDLDQWTFWSCTSQLHRRLFVEDVHGGTLVYRWRVWQELARYPDRSLAEDAVFLRQAVRLGARLHRLPNDNLYFYLRHGQNSWSFVCGRYLDARGWQRIGEPMLPPEDRAFYAARSTAQKGWPAALPAGASGDQPLVSCIMPTANRRALVPQAIHYFLGQSYANRELIIVDDGPAPAADLIPADPRIRYWRLTGKHTVGAKRNLACQEARGEIIVHWDDDDWMASWRLDYQVTTLLKEGVDICGLARVFYYDPRAGQAWQYVYPEGGKPWVAGNTLCYTKSTWQRSPFPEVNVGEDTRFVWSKAVKKIYALPEVTFYVALIHSGNTSKKHPAGERWQAMPVIEIHQLLGKDALFYA
ncbi:MAG: glycosyltransferase [Chloroflexi bacterium]|nr:glycosyltransferase [Chloroflexota bacterium]MCI0577008.1 glycosyltransferase [Chloroflexota bacterium]MCI0647771.1 glycosyltransferase [Chloroflexota bacterium]MCI0729027.1 glycosyltransferase [Chloroflexota bacterium]